MSLSERVQERAYQRRWLILLVLCFSLLVIVLDNTILNVAIPTLSRELDPTNSQLQWMVDSYTLVFAGLLLTAGSLGDRFGRRGALQVGLIIFGLGSLLSALAGLRGPAHRHARVHGHRRRVHHAGDAVDHHERLPANERGRAIGVWAGTAGIGIALGPLTGGFLLEHFYWGSIFLVNLPIVAIGLVAGIFLIPTSKDPNAPEARSARRGALDHRSDRAALRHHRSADRRLDRPDDPRLVRVGDRAARRVHLVAAHDRPPDARRPLLQEPAVHRGEHRHHDDVLRAVRRNLPAHPVHAVRARLLAARKPASGCCRSPGSSSWCRR